MVPESSLNRSFTVLGIYIQYIAYLDCRTVIACSLKDTTIHAFPADTCELRIEPRPMLVNEKKVKRMKAYASRSSTQFYSLLMTKTAKDTLTAKDKRMHVRT